MSIDTDAAALRKIPLFRGIEDQKLAGELASMFLRYLGTA